MDLANKYLMLGGIDKPICCCHFEGGESLFSPSLSLPLSLSPSLSLSLPLSFFFFSSLFLLPFSSLSLSLFLLSPTSISFFSSTGEEDEQEGYLPANQSRRPWGRGEGKWGQRRQGWAGLDMHNPGAKTTGST